MYTGACRPAGPRPPVWRGVRGAGRRAAVSLIVGGGPSTAAATDAPRRGSFGSVSW